MALISSILECGTILRCSGGCGWWIWNGWLYTLMDVTIGFGMSKTILVQIFRAQMFFITEKRKILWVYSGKTGFRSIVLQILSFDARFFKNSWSYTLTDVAIGFSRSRTIKLLICEIQAAFLAEKLEFFRVFTLFRPLCSGVLTILSFNRTLCENGWG